MLRRKGLILIYLALISVIILGCSVESKDYNSSGNENELTDMGNESEGEQIVREDEQKLPEHDTPPIKEEKNLLEDTIEVDADGKHIVTNPLDILVLVNKKRNLPEDFVPPDLVEPRVAFTFTEKLPKRLMRQEAAIALEELFAAAAEDGIELLGQSAYRSYERQEAIFAYNAKTRGEAEANKVSAYPGQSEHQTGLAIDVTSRSANFALAEIFGETPEGIWLKENAATFGFIIRYPQGKEDITGYNYEPWHIRYVGKEVAQEIYTNNLTLEEYFLIDKEQH